MPIYTEPQQVSFTVVDPPDAAIYYTTDGSPPTAASTLFNPAVPIYVAVTTFFRVIGIKAPYLDSEILDYTVEIELDKVYFGYSPLTDLTEAQILAMSNAPGVNNVTASDAFGTFTFESGATASDYFYFWWPDTFSDPSSGVGFILLPGGLSCAMAEASQGFTDISANGWGRKPKTVNGISGWLFRSFYPLGNGTNQDITVQ